MRAEFTFLAVLVAIVTALFFYPATLTGNAALNFDVTSQNNALAGSLSYDTSEGVALPLDSEVIVGLNNYYSRKPLLQLVDSQFVELYAQTIEFAPAVQVEMDIRSPLVINTHSSQFSTTNEQSEGELFSLRTSPTGFVTIELVPSGGSGGSGGPSVVPSSAEGSGGELENERTNLYLARYTLRYGDEVALPQGTYTIRSVRLVRGDALTSSDISITSRGGENYLRTNYFEVTQGFPRGTPRISVDISSFDLTPGPKAQLSAILYYEGEKLDQTQKTISSSTSPFFSPQDGVSSLNSAEDLLKMGCVVSHCGAYSKCSTSFGQDSFSVSKDSLFQVRTCKYTDCGLTYKEQRSCTPDSISVDVVPRESSSGLLTSPPLSPLPTPSAWRETYSFINQELDSLGSIEQNVGTDERLRLLVDESVHTVGVLRITDEDITFEVASAPQQSTLRIGESAFFDLNGKDAYYDLKVTLLRIVDNRADIRVEPTRENIPFGALRSGDKAVTLVKPETNEPVAHLIVNNARPLVDVIFVESYEEAPYECYNAVRDAGEDDVDCGGICGACVQQSPRYVVPGLLWIVAAVLGVSAGLVLRRSSY